MTQYNGHYEVQGHSRSPLWVLIESRVRLPKFLLVNNTNLYRISHHFQDTAVIVDRKCLSLTHSFGVKSKLMIAKFVFRKIETSFYATMQAYLDILTRLG